MSKARVPTDKHHIVRVRLEYLQTNTILYV